MIGKRNPVRIQSVERALMILEQLAARRDGMGIMESAERLGISPSTLHHILSTLIARGYVNQDPATKRYKAGMRIFELASMVLSNVGLKDFARPVLEELVRTANETAHLTVLDGGEGVHIEEIESSHVIKISLSVGRRIPLHCSAAGKALLAYLPERRVDEIVQLKGLTRYTENTIVSEERLREELSEIRRTGCAFDREEYEEGVYCVGAPVRDYTGGVIAALSISGPASRIRAREEELSRLAVEFADRVSRISRDIQKSEAV